MPNIYKPIEAMDDTVASFYLHNIKTKKRKNDHYLYYISEKDC